MPPYGAGLRTRGLRGQTVTITATAFDSFGNASMQTVTVRAR